MLARFLVVLALPLIAVACDNRRDPVVLPAQFNLTPTGALPANSAIASLAITGERSGVALMNSFFGSTEAIFAFDPVAGTVTATVNARHPLTFNPPLPNSAGVMVSTTTTSLPAFAATSNGKLYVTTNNVALPPNSGFNPGTVLSYDYDASTNAIGAFRGPILTAHGGQTFYNPTWLTAFTRPGEGEKLAVVCAAPFFTGHDAAVVVIDPLTDTVAESVTIGATTAGAGEGALAPDLRMYIGSSVASEFYIVNLATTPPTLERGASNPVVVSSTSAIFNNVGDIALNHDGTRLFVLNSNEGALSIFSRANPSDPILLQRTNVFKRSKPNAPFEASPLTLAVRPGRPGIDYRFTPDVAIGTIQIQAAADQQVPTVQTAIDSVTTYTGVIQVNLNAVVTPFTPFTDLQHVVAPSFGALEGFLFAVEGNTGKVIVRHFDGL